MAKYLLADGSITDSENDYIMDIFVTRLKLLDTELAHSSNNGIRKTYDGLPSDALVDMLYYNVISMAAEISNKINVKDISFQDNGYVISASINNSNNYELSVRY